MVGVTATFNLAPSIATEIVVANYDIVVGVPTSPQPTRALSKQKEMEEGLRLVLAL